MNAMIMGSSPIQAKMLVALEQSNYLNQELFEKLEIWN